MNKLISAGLTVVMALSAFAFTPLVEVSKVYAESIKGRTTSEVNVRSGAGTSYEVLGTLDKGKKISITGAKKAADGSYWYKTTYKSKKGYVSNKYVTRIGFTTKTVTAGKGKVTANDVNVRLGPGTEYPVFKKVAKGKKYTMDGKATDSKGLKWYRITYGGLKVYISATYFKVESATTKTTTKTTTSTPKEDLYVKAIIEDTVNVRKGAGTKYKKLGKLSRGKKVKIIGAKKDRDGSYWYKIIYKSKTGYINNKYATRIGYSSTSITKKTRYAKEGDINVRLGPGTKYPSIGKTKFAKKYKVNGKAKDGNGKKWYRITLGGIKVYIRADYLSSKVPVTTTTQPPASSPGQPSVDPNAPKIQTSNLTYPKTILKSKAFTLAGELTCEKKITKVETGIQGDDGNWISGYKVTNKPNSKSFNIKSNVDELIKFGSLKVGSYKYVCFVTTSYGTVPAFSYSFNVVEAPSITITGLTYPTTLSQYKGFTLKGTVKSTQKINSLTLGITNSSGTWLSGFKFTVKPNAKSYDLSKLDESIKFGNLATGSYCYKCTVSTETLNQTLFTYSFVVNKNTGIPSTKPYGKLTGKKAKDIVSIAMAQEGYKTYKENHTAYNLWYYGKDTSAAWCAIFVSWCANQANVSTGVIPKMAYVPSITAWYQSKGRFNAKKTLPKKGDLIIYAGSSHIGIVTEDVESKSGYVSTIEGNTGKDEVKYRKNYMKWNSSNIKGYCHPAY